MSMFSATGREGVFGRVSLEILGEGIWGGPVRCARFQNLSGRFLCAPRLRALRGLRVVLECGVSLDRVRVVGVLVWCV